MFHCPRRFGELLPRGFAVQVGPECARNGGILDQWCVDIRRMH